MEGACSETANRLVRTRMLGGVGGAAGNRAPIPIHIVTRRLALRIWVLLRGGHRIRYHRARMVDSR